MRRERAKRTGKSPDSKNRLRLWLRLLRSSRAIESTVRERLRVTYGVTLPQFDVMAALNRYDGAINMSEISRFLMVSNGNVTGIVDRLVADGMATRTQGTDDRRKSFVQFTGKGRAAFAVMAADHECWVDELLGGIESGKVAKLVEDLRCVMPQAGGDPGGQ